MTIFSEISVFFKYNLLVGAESPHLHFSNGLRKQSETQRKLSVLQFYLPKKNKRHVAGKNPSQIPIK